MTASTSSSSSSSSQLALHVVFMGTGSRDGIESHTRVVSMFTRSEWTHCELYFPLPQHETFTADLNHGCVYSINETRGLRAGWQTYKCNVTRAQYDAVYKYCCEARGSRFNKGSYFGFLCGPGLCYESPESSQRSYICARLVCEALQAGAVISAKIDSQQIHVGDLHREVLSVASPFETQLSADQARTLLSTSTAASSRTEPMQRTEPFALAATAPTYNSNSTPPPQQQTFQFLGDVATFARGAQAAIVQSAHSQMAPLISLASPSQTSSTTAATTTTTAVARSQQSKKTTNSSNADLDEIASYLNKKT